MMNWISSNHEWLFSGAGVTAIVLLGTWIVTQSRSKAVKTSPIDTKPLQTAIEASPLPIRRPDEFKIGITPMEIGAQLDETPMLQYSEVKRHFEGLKVEWDCRLTEATNTRDDRARLFLRHIEDKNAAGLAVICEIDPAQYPGIGLLRRGHKIRVSGDIDKIEKLYMEMRNVTLSFDV